MKGGQSVGRAKGDRLAKGSGPHEVLLLRALERQGVDVVVGALRHLAEGGVALEDYQVELVGARRASLPEDMEHCRMRAGP